MAHERRRAPRTDTDMTGRIVPGVGVPMGCRVRDRSGTGAQLRVNSVFWIPDTFRLEIPLTGEELQARVVRRSAGNLGIAIE
ncbi:PilZ domain-containing protein [Methylobacterium sp. A49B]